MPLRRGSSKARQILTYGAREERGARGILVDARDTRNAGKAGKGSGAYVNIGPYFLSSLAALPKNASITKVVRER